MGSNLTMEQYQDIWIKGRRVVKGVRECESRYAMVHALAARYRRPFTVLDVGAAAAYFSIRLTEDFSGCTAVAIDFDPRLPAILERNENPRVVLLHRRTNLRELRALAAVEHFDIVLATSVIHHLGGTYDEGLETLSSLGDHLVVEIPVEDRACGQSVVKSAYVPPDATLLGHGQSHLDGAARRPIFLSSTPKTTLEASFFGAPANRKTHIRIRSDFDSKTIAWDNGKEDTRAWLRGINLQSYLKLGGRYPSRRHIAESLLRHGVPGGEHRDIEPWNVILQGDDTVLIDYGHNRSVHGRSDAECLRRLVGLLDPTVLPDT